MAQWDSRSALEAGANELSDSDRVVLERYAAFNRTITMPGGSAQQQFEAAVQLIRGLPKNGPFQPSNDMKLRLYGFFKQATEGPCTQPAPSFWDVIGKAKWGAWKNLGDMPSEQAMTSYVDEIKKVMETMSLTDDVANLMDTLGPVYEYVDEDAAGRPSRKKHVRFSADEEPPAATNGHDADVTEAEAADAEAAAETGVESEAHPAGQNGVSAPIPVDNGRAPSQQRQQQERWAGSPTSDTDDDEEFNDPIGEADSLSGGRLSTEARLDALHQQLTALSRLMDSAGAPTRPHQSTAVAQLTNGVKAGSAGSSSSVSAGASTCAAGVHDELRALVRDMRDDLDTVTGRLRRLEAAHISSAASEKVAVRPWWQVPELSAGSVAVLLAWPLVLQLVLRLISSRRRR